MLSFLYWLFRDALFFFGVVSGRSSFPRPLSREEEQKAIAAMQAGDEDARRRLIEHNLRLVSHIAKKYTVPGFDGEDLVSVGALGLVKAVNTFRPETGAQLSSYAARCIENEILMLLRASRKRRKEKHVKIRRTACADGTAGVKYSKETGRGGKSDAHAARMSGPGGNDAAVLVRARPMRAFLRGYGLSGAVHHGEPGQDHRGIRIERRLVLDHPGRRNTDLPRA